MAMTPMEFESYDSDTITTGIANASGTLRFYKKNGMVTLIVDVSPSSSSNITFTIPEKYRPITGIYHQYYYNTQNVYLYFYNTGAATIIHTNTNDVLTTVSYVGNDL